MNSTNEITNNEIEELLIKSESGARKPQGAALFIMTYVAIFWSLFQIWVSSPLPYTDFAYSTLSIPILNSTDSRMFHLAIALFLAFVSYPLKKSSPHSYVPLYDWTFAILALVTVLYMFFFKDVLIDRIGIPNLTDITISVAGILILLEGTRRALGLPLILIALIFLSYAFFGDSSFIPEAITHKPQSLEKIASQQWLTTEGVFGIAVGVSSDFVFLFVLFGALLETAGAGNYFIKLAFSLLGQFRGGPAKAAVLSSAFTGLISGSSIANVVTTGTFTIPLMRQGGFSREKAGAVEVASSVNGQIMPPVMGAAAFLIVEYLNMSYVEVVKHAFIPAFISYAALLYIVHLEALKMGQEPLKKVHTRSFWHRTLFSLITICSIILLSGVVYVSIGWLKTLLEDKAVYVVSSLLFSLYIYLIWYASKFPDLDINELSNNKDTVIEPASKTLKTGLHYLLPIVILIWCLMVERFSPGLSCFWSVSFMIFILITQKPLKAFFRKSGQILPNLKEGILDTKDGLFMGARNMTGIAIATASAGIIVGCISLTGIGQIMTEFVAMLSGGSFILSLLFTAFICLFLGMGLPTTANYIVVASLMAKVIENIAMQNGIVVAPIAVHLFVFYFGIMADVTPPVGLASFAAAAVSGGDPISTGLQAFVYSLRTIILPFVFVYNPELLLVGVDNNILLAIFVFFKALIAIMIFTAGTQGYFVVKNKFLESLMLILMSFMFFNANFFIDLMIPRYKAIEITKLDTFLETDFESGRRIKFSVNGLNKSSFEQQKMNLFATLKEDYKNGDFYKKYGISVERNKLGLLVKSIDFFSEAKKDGFDFDYVITGIEVPNKQISRLWLYLIASIGTILIIVLQKKRKNKIST